jgi:hypothetical protein
LTGKLSIRPKRALYRLYNIGNNTKCILDVRPSACVPPGVSVKFSLMNEGILGRCVSGSAGRKRMRWSSAFFESLDAIVLMNYPERC